MNVYPQVQSIANRDKILVYFLAAANEEDEYRAIRKHLTPAIRNSKIPIEIDSDYDIPLGEDIEKYKLKLLKADIVLALISVDFIDDDEINERNKKVIERYNNNQTILVPILVRNCQWTKTPFVNLQLLPKNLQPLNNKQFWNSDDDALMAVVDDIYDALEAFSNVEIADEQPVAELKNVPPIHLQQPVNLAGESIPASQTGETVVETDPVNRVMPQPAPAGPELKQEVPPGKPEQTASPDHEYKSKVQSFSGQPRVNIPIDVDWRKQYYKDVFWKRAFAFILDQFLVLVPSFFLFSIFLAPFLPEGELREDQYEQIGYAAFMFYFVVCAVMESSKLRGTFGKRLLKLQITDKHGHPISFFRALWRNISRVIVAYSFIFVIPAIIQIFTFRKYKKFFHDQLSNTVIGERLQG